jgi:hypothetical protein
MKNQTEEPRMKSTDHKDTLDVLKSELAFIEHGGYGRSVRTPWRPTSIFLDSPSCLNFSDPQRSHPCEECLLMNFVPPERRDAGLPCHHIPLTTAGDTVHSAAGWADQSELEEAVKGWLRRSIIQLEQRKHAQQSGPEIPGNPLLRIECRDSCF